MFATVSRRPLCVLRSYSSTISLYWSPFTQLTTAIRIVGAFLSTRPQPAADELIRKSKSETIRQNVSAYRHIYPEFLPDPNPNFRNHIREKLERNDMIARRTQIDIPEFYVGKLFAYIFFNK